MLRLQFLALFLAFLFLSCQNKEPDTLFTLLTARKTNVNFTNIIKESNAFNVLSYAYLYNGGGVAVGDINNDGLPDIYFTGNLVNSKLYLNEGGLSFKDISKEAGVLAGGLWNTGTCMVDINGDGFLDIYVCRSAAKDPEKRRNLLFINNGELPNGQPSLTFEEQAKSYGLDDSSYSTHAAFFDYDKDGDLDIYILNHSLDKYASFNDNLNALKNTESDKFSDKLLRNDNGKFVDVSAEAGLINNVLGFGLGLAVVDVNNDNWPDMYISNDYNEEDYLYINQKDGTFKESIRENMGHVSLSSMGNESGDINNDLRPDIISLDMLPEKHYELKMSRGSENYGKYNKLINSGFHYQTIRNMLQLNNGNGTFSEIGQLAGIARTDWSWAPLLADFDNDGWKDLFISNGYGKNYLDMDVMGYVVNEKLTAKRENRQMIPLEILDGIPDLKLSNYMYKNNRDLTFSDVTNEWGLEGRTLSNGAAYADLDNDGDLDLIINNINEKAAIYRNNSNRNDSSNYLKIQLKGKSNNTFGIGAKVIIKTETASQYQEMMPSRGYLSSVNPEILFGLGHNNIVDSITILWPDESIEILTDVDANQVLILTQSQAKNIDAKGSEIIPVFKEAKIGIDFVHKEHDFMDFNIDKLLPRGLSREGPATAFGDVNNDGLEDFFIGGSKGHAGAIYLQNNKGLYKRFDHDIFENDKEFEDNDAVFFDADGDGDMDLYVVSGGNEIDNDSLLQDRLYSNIGSGEFIRKDNALPKMQTLNSCVTYADIDNDNDIDLFIGARVIPGNYPLAPPSYILLNDGFGIFSNATNNICYELNSIGMVSDAIFTDINGDKFPDLIVVGEWMKISVFINNKGHLVEQKSNGLDDTFGWWNVIKSCDIDGDGDSDLIAGNMGMNNAYKATPFEPVRLYYADFDNNGNVDPFMTYYINGESALAFSRDEFISQMSSLKSKFITYDSFAKLKGKDIKKELNLQSGDSLKATTFYSSVFLNNGHGSFKQIHLTQEAQFSPVYAIETLDFDGDGIIDIVLGGNQSNTRVTTGRLDAMYGLVLQGQGNGIFNTIDPVKSGIKVSGDVRSIKHLKHQEDQYLMFFLNNGEPKIYKF